MDNKILVALISIIIVTSAFYLVPTQEIKPANCNSMGVIFLKPSESYMASDIANKINGLVIIPEEGKTIGRTEVLKCNNFNLGDYI